MFLYARGSQSGLIESQRSMSTKKKTFKASGSSFSLKVFNFCKCILFHINKLYFILSFVVLQV